MDSFFRPSKSARLSDTSEYDSRLRSNGSPSLGLGLALGTGGSEEKRPMPNSGKALGFTILQMQELQLQTAIYKYIEAGSPVPYHLLLPIWRCLSNSSFPFPNFLRGSGDMRMENRIGMDLEPGRCKRTDGKKWRCSKEALPDQKYCERHMHRGRQRTRKLMEVAAQMNNSIASTNLSIALPNPGSNNDHFMFSSS